MKRSTVQGPDLAELAQPKRLDAEVLVIGAGPVGMALAHGLRSRGVDVLLVEKSTRLQPAFKGEYIQPAGVRLLESLELDPSRGSPSAERVSELRFRDLDRGDEIISDLLMPYAKGESALAISHLDLITSLRAQVAPALGDRFIEGLTLKPASDDHQELLHNPVLRGESPTLGAVEIRAKYVVGCDGRGSVVRSWMQGPRVPANAHVVAGAPSEWIVGAELEHPAPIPRRYEVFRSYTQGTLSSFSLAERGQRLYLSSLEGASKSGALLSRQASALLSRVRRQAPLGELGFRTRVASFPAYTQWFGPVQKGHFLLAGDAASVTTPYGGQGMAAGFEAVQNLLEWLPEAVKSADWSVSRRFHEHQYALKVRKTFYRHSLLNFGLYYLFFSREPIFKKVSAHVIENWHRHPHLRQRVMNLFGGTDQDVPGPTELAELWGLAVWPTARRWPSIQQNWRHA